MNACILSTILPHCSPGKWRTHTCRTHTSLGSVLSTAADLDRSWGGGRRCSVWCSLTATSCPCMWWHVIWPPRPVHTCDVPRPMLSKHVMSGDLPWPTHLVHAPHYEHVLGLGFLDMMQVAFISFSHSGNGLGLNVSKCVKLMFCMPCWSCRSFIKWCYLGFIKFYQF